MSQQILDFSQMTQEEKIQHGKMEEFCDFFKDQFNESQIEVLKKVKNMP